MVSELTEVRAEDSFDVGAVQAWLIKNTDVADELPRVQQFGSGASNLTYLLTYKDNLRNIHHQKKLLSHKKIPKVMPKM